MNDIIQLKITLKWTKPPIWRRVLVDKKTTFSELHNIIQIIMGWEDFHLFEFRTPGFRIGIPYDDDFGFGQQKFVDASKKTLDSVIKKMKQEIEYEYDFGDGWIHQIVAEKFSPRDSETNYPICIKGKLNAPPEDCGGIPGFYSLIDIIGDKEDPEREEMLEWLGDEYDPEYFDKEEINRQLMSLSL